MTGNEVPNWQAYGIPAIYIIVAIINWLKTAFNMDSKWAFPVGTAIGVIFGGLLFLSEQYVWALTLFQVLMGGLLIGLQASGLYSNTKFYVKNRLGEDTALSEGV